MSTRRDRRIIYYLIAAAVIIIAFLFVRRCILDERDGTWQRFNGYGQFTLGTDSDQPGSGVSARVDSLQKEMVIV